VSRGVERRGVGWRDEEWSTVEERCGGVECMSGGVG
jgi:hypothetical protein